MHRQAIMYGCLAILVIAVVVTAGIFVYKAGQRSGGPATGTVTADEGLEQESSTRAAVPPGTTVPEEGASAPSNVAVPEAVSPTAPGASTKARGFEMKIDGGKFIPDTVIVYVGDIAHIEFTAVDKEYDVVQPDTGFKLQILKGATKLLEGQFPAPGKYTIYCPSCGGPDKGPVGYITVVPK